MELLPELVRARALEEVLTRLVARNDGPPALPRPVSPAVPAALALRRALDGSGDVFSLRVGSPASALAMGLAPEEILRQAMGTASAPARGRDPGGFPTDLARGVLAPFHLPGTLAEVVAGIALSFAMRDEPRVALLVDDVAGSASGDWHEGLNFAAVRRVPMVLVVDAAGRGTMDAPVDSMEERAPAYGFTAHAVDGTDPRKVERVVRSAVKAARGGGGVQVVEVGAPGEDPVSWLLTAAADAGELGPSGVGSLESEAGAEMARALDAVAAETAPDPAREVIPGIRTPLHWSAR